MNKKRIVIALFFTLIVCLFGYAGMVAATEATNANEVAHLEAQDTTRSLNLELYDDEHDGTFMDYFEGHTGRHRPLFYNLPYHIIQLVGIETFFTWERSWHEAETTGESIVVGFIRYFNISKDDFNRANEEMRQFRMQFYVGTRNHLDEIYPVDLIFSFDNDLISEYFLWENSPFPVEFGMITEFSPAFGRYRNLHYHMPPPFQELVGRLEFIQWRRARSDEERENENIAISFIRHFDISMEDFVSANQEMYQVWRIYGFADEEFYLRAVDGGYVPPRDSSKFEVYPVDLIFSMDNTLINEFFLWENSPFDHEREHGQTITQDIANADITITPPAPLATPSTTATATGNFTTSDVTWQPVVNAFESYNGYTATVTLFANSGYTFAALSTATINGKNAEIILNTGSRIILSHTFQPSYHAPETTAHPRIQIDGQFIQIPAHDQQPIMINGRILVPMRAVMQELGFAVEWDSAMFTGWLSKPGFTVLVPADSYHIIVNGNIIELDVPARLVNGRILVPLRAISVSTGMDVRWDEVGLIASIYTSD